LGDVEIRGAVAGGLHPEMTVGVVHKTGGKVSEKLVRDGDRVQAGALILRLDSAEISAQLAQAEANIRVIEIQLESATNTLEDSRLLFAENIISRQQLEQAETQCKILEAQIAQIEASMELLNINLENTSITAPISGTIHGLSVNVGEMISPGMPVATINRLDPMEVHVQLTEKDVGRVDVGQAVDVFVTAATAEPLEGRVVSISPIADARTKSYLMKVSLANGAGRLRAGMTATVELILSAEENTVIVPAEAVLTQQGRHVVYVLEDEGEDGDGEGEGEGNGKSPLLRHVTIGLVGESTISILEGLAPGERVIVNGQHYIRDGRKVVVVGGVD